MPSRAPSKPYHHGNLRAALLAAAADTIAKDGAAGLSLRDLSRRVGVTHGAAAHHFGDKTGLLTALAADGYRILSEELTSAWAEQQDFADVGVAYVRFAVRHPAHFEIMFRPELYRADDPRVAEAKLRSAQVLYGSAKEVSDAAGGDATKAGIAAWAYVHGIATLWRDGNLPPTAGNDPINLAREIGPYLFQSSAARRRNRRARPGTTRRYSERRPAG